MEQRIEEILVKLKQSPFRSKFHLKDKDKLYIKEKGMAKIQEHAYDFISMRLEPKVIANDGKQTPMRGHPVFIAQHATATCCRGCLNKWYRIEKEKDLSPRECDFIVAIIMAWIHQEMM